MNIFSKMPIFVPDMQVNKKISSFLAALVLLLGNAMAAEVQDTAHAVVLNPVVVTGTGTYHKSKDAPVAVKVISAKELQDAGVTSLQEALTRLTTTITTHTNGMGTFVNFNGVSDDYILILENGKRVSGDDRWQRLNISNIKRIEIFSGAASALYGSDALAGVINIITDDSKNRVEVQNRTQMRSRGRLDEEINVDITAGKFSSYTNYSHHQAQNWQVNHYQEFAEGDSSVLKLTGRPMSTGYHSDNLSERMEWRFDDRWSVYLRGSYYDYHTDRPQSATYFKQSVDKSTGVYEYTEKQAYTYDLFHKSYNYGGGARFVPNSRTHLYLDVYSDNFSSKYDYWQTGEKEAYSVTRKRTHYTNETLRGIFRLADWNKLSAGMEFVQESLTSQSDNINGEHTATYNLFAQDEMQIVGGLEALLGLRYTYNDKFGSALTPNVGLFYHVGDFRFRASYAGGYRTPTLSQLYATDQAKTAARYTLYNPSLDPEKNHFWNLNAEYSNSWLSVSVTGFINKIRDMINLRVMTQQEIEADAHLSALYDEGWTTIRQRDNIDRATLQGVSAQVKLLLPQGVTLSGGYTFTDAKAKTKSLDSKTQQYLVEETDVDKSVRHVGNINASWDRTWRRYHLNVTLGGHMQGERYSSTYGYADGYSQFDLNTRHTVTLDKFILEPGIGIENIFNKRDTSYWNSNYSTINPGRTLMLSLTLKFRN